MPSWLGKARLRKPHTKPLWQSRPTIPLPPLKPSIPWPRQSLQHLWCRPVSQTSPILTKTTCEISSWKRRARYPVTARKRFVCSKPNRAMSVSSPFCAVFSTPSKAARAWSASMSSVKRAGPWSSCLTAGWLTKSRPLKTCCSCRATAWKGFLAGLATLTPIRTRRGAQGLSAPVLKRCALRAVWSPSCFRVWLLPCQWLSSNCQH